MTLLFHALWMLCGFGAVVFAATAIRGRWSVAVGACGFVLGALAAGIDGGPDPVWVAGLAVLVAVLVLTWPRHWILASASCGLCAGIWGSLFQAQGLPAASAYASAAAVPALSAWLAARRPVFAPPILRDERLLAVFVLGIAVAIAPAIAEGWRAAMNLTLESGTMKQPVPAWTVALAGASLASGGMYALWSRR